MVESGQQHTVSAPLPPDHEMPAAAGHRRASSQPVFGYSSLPSAKRGPALVYVAGVPVMEAVELAVQDCLEMPALWRRPRSLTAFGLV
jgi:hypothetical protein